MAVALAALQPSFEGAAQSPARAAPPEPDEETVRIRTREVFVEVLVRDRRTGAPVADLARESFELFDEGRPRRLSHFSRAGEARRRPLALVLVLDLKPGGAGRFLRRPGAAEAFAAALRRLPPEDEVAVLATSVEGVWGKRQWLAGLTRERDEIAAALAAVPGLVGERKVYRKEHEHSFGDAVEEVARLAAEARPNSQVVLVLVTDGVNSTDSLFYQERDELGQRLLRSNVIFSALTHDLAAKKKALVLASRPIFLLARASAVGNEQHFAKLTGGEALGVESPEEYAAGLERLVGALSARYSLGFTLGEEEPDDGRLRRLEVRVTARDAGGRQRRLEVRARRGYRLPRAGAGS